MSVHFVPESVCSDEVYRIRNNGSQQKQLSVVSEPYLSYGKGEPNTNTRFFPGKVLDATIGSSAHNFYFISMQLAAFTLYQCITKNLSLPYYTIKQVPLLPKSEKFSASNQNGSQKTHKSYQPSRLWVRQNRETPNSSPRLDMFCQVWARVGSL